MMCIVKSGQKPEGGPAMNLKWLEAFVTVARVGRINEAAAQLNLSQSTLSRQLAGLERQLGTELLIRQARGVSLTETGRAVFRRAVQLMDEFKNLHELIDAENRRTVVVRVGLPPGIPKAWARQHLKDMPGVSLVAEEWTTNEQLELLRSGHLDVAFTHDPSSTYPSQLVLIQPLGVAMPRSSRLAQRLSEDGSLGVVALDGMRIMAHAQSAMRSSEGSLRSLASRAGVDVEWVFRRFGQHGDLIGEIAEADGAMTTESSQLVAASEWSWHPLIGSSPVAADLSIRTWVNWRPDAIVGDFVASIPSGGERQQVRTGPTPSGKYLPSARNGGNGETAKDTGYLDEV